MGNRSFAFFLMIFLLCCGISGPKWDTNSGVIIQKISDIGLFEEITSLEKSYPHKTMKSEGIAGAAGGMHLKAFKSGIYFVRLPLPQLIDFQCPLYYSLRANPESTLEEKKIQQDISKNAFLILKFKAEKNQEIRLEWSSAVLLRDKPFVNNESKADAFISSTPCVQSDSTMIKQLSEKLFPDNKSIKKYAENIRTFIMEMKQKKQPKSLDAVEILESRCNFICTSNANLAAALFRARNIPARSVACLPIISSRFEMHRIVEYFDDGKWFSFDPSGVFGDIPLKPQQNVIMSKTSLEDEKESMKLRPGSMPGAPFGQEAEFANLGLNLFGEDFFWSIALPLAEFEISDEDAEKCANLWKQFLQSGNVDERQNKAALSRTQEDFQISLK